MFILTGLVKKGLCIKSALNVTPPLFVNEERAEYHESTICFGNTILTENSTTMQKRSRSSVNIAAAVSVSVPVHLHERCLQIAVTVYK